MKGSLGSFVGETVGRCRWKSGMGWICPSCHHGRVGERLGKKNCLLKISSGGIVMSCLNVTLTIMLFPCLYQAPGFFCQRAIMNVDWDLGSVLVLHRKPVVQLSPRQGLGRKSPSGSSVLKRISMSCHPSLCLSREAGRIGCPDSAGNILSVHRPGCSSSSPLLGELPGTPVFGANWRKTRHCFAFCLPPSFIEESIPSSRNIPLPNCTQHRTTSTAARSH